MYIAYGLGLASHMPKLKNIDDGLIQAYKLFLCSSPSRGRRRQLSILNLCECPSFFVSKRPSVVIFWRNGHGPGSLRTLCEGFDLTAHEQFSLLMVCSMSI